MGWFKFIRNFPAGVFVGLLIGMAYMTVVGGVWSDKVDEYGVYIITTIATLFASAVAITTAIWDAEYKRRRKLNAARAALPLALSDLVLVAEQVFQLSILPKRDFRSEKTRREINSILKTDLSAFDTIRSCIESSDDVTGEFLAGIIRHYQIYRARILGSAEDPRMAYLREDHPAEWAFFLALLNECFDFARGYDAVICHDLSDASFPGQLTRNFIDLELSGKVQKRFNSILAYYLNDPRKNPG
jgi:hypothetical protein